MDNQSAGGFFRAVRRFALTTRPWESAIWYDTKPDERLDLTLVSERVYGRRSEYLAVMAAAGLSHVDDELTERKLCLPTEAQLAAFKRASGYLS
ncbi:MAG: hypothetical protein EOM21_21710 [Gammaproteobacteria bacterium]|nr:hypothetical protein [Gammaproteobacteria bacterium]